MPSDSLQPYRRSLRWRGYDYSQVGVYFVTICTEKRLCLFGEIQEREMIPNAAGEMLARQWLALPTRFPNVILDQWTVMPNHFHGIVVINQKLEPQLNNTMLGNIIGAWKSLTTRAYSTGITEENWSPFLRRLWQRNYYEHVVRSERACSAIREYIALNPARWPNDKDNRP